MDGSAREKQTASSKAPEEEKVETQLSSSNDKSTNESVKNLQQFLSGLIPAKRNGMVLLLPEPFLSKLEGGIIQGQHDVLAELTRGSPQN